MNKSELVKNAINQCVVLEDATNSVYRGWLVVDNNRKNSYLILPFSQCLGSNDLVSFNVSGIKHLTYINSGYKLW